MSAKPRKPKDNLIKDATSVVKEAYDLTDKLVAYVKDHPANSREACLLIMAIELWKSAVVGKKIDAVAMGMYGMQHFFENAPEDCGRLGLSLAESPDGEVGIAIFPKDDPGDGDGKTELH